MATNNRFKKSIDNATENTQENIIDNVTENALDNVMENMIENTIDNAQGNVKTIISSKTSNDILKKVLESGKKDKGGNHTIYLSSDVGEALVKLAKKSKKSKSTLVDEILREVLLSQ